MRIFTPILFAALITIAAPARADISEPYGTALDALKKVMPVAAELMADGQFDVANKKVLDTFPEATRTPVQMFVLANVLYPLDPKISYALHKQAAEGLPDEAAPQLEWALEQHRAGEYAGAVASYTKYLKANPEHAPAWGMLAECLIRTGQIRPAVDAWLRSEAATRGTLITFETWDCEVHTHSQLEREHGELLTKAKTGDLEAAEKLVEHDADYRPDWWNQGPRESYLLKDIEWLGKAKFADQGRLAEILAVAECALAFVKEGGTDQDKISAVLHKRGFIIDEKNTLPKAGGAIAFLLDAAMVAKVVTEAEVRQKWGAAIQAQARATNDKELYNVWRNLSIGTDQQMEVDQAAWNASGEAKFAVSLLYTLYSQDKLTLDDPRLVKAAAQFPEDADIAGLVFRLTHKAGKPEQEAIIRAIKAEYTHFTLNSTPRPAANALRGYFYALADELGVKRP